jgi:aspartate/methionine/tyrosine aminotransferase
MHSLVVVYYTTTALYAFPTITLPAKAVAAAKAKGFAADEYYCLQMLDLAGVILVPGSGFGQEPGIAITTITVSLHNYYTRTLS